jgi:signal recognition particle receptor subunit beta
MMDANLETLLDLEKHLSQDCRTLEHFPWVLQYNKQDIPSALSIEEMNNKLNYFGVPAFEAVATEGKGVFATMKQAIKQVMAHVQKELSGRPTVMAS